MDLTGKNIVLIGGGGIGLETCRILLEKKIANLVVADCVASLSALDDLQKKYQTTVISFFQLDITKKEDVEKVFANIIKKIKNIDVLINAAGVCDEREPELTVNVNLMGLIHTTLSAYSHMDKAKGGSGGLIVNISSILGLMTCPPLAIYSATKAGVLSFTRSLAADYYHSKSGVSLIVICPGQTDTPMTEDLANKLTFPHDFDVFGQSDNLIQSAEDCAVNLVKAIEKNKNGSVWICYGSKSKEINPENIFNPRAWNPTD